MAAEGLWGPGGPPDWELDGWYEDLQEVLAAEPPRAAPTWAAEQVPPGPGGFTLDAVLAEELLQLLEPEGAGAAGPPGTAGPPGAAGPPGTTPAGSAPARPGPAEEEEEEEAARRKRRGGAGRERERQRDRDGQRRVRELTEHNERLRAEIERLSAEVQRTRTALIERIVSLRQE